MRFTSSAMNRILERILDSASWGIIAPWQKSFADARASQSHAINARSESIHEKPTFRQAFRTSRCLIPATGYYEWATSLGKYAPKQPFYISAAKMKNNFLSLESGVHGRVKKASRFRALQLLLAKQLANLATIHSRMPVFMPIERWNDWLDPQSRDINRLINMMNIPRARCGAHCSTRRVSSRVNVVANNGPELIIPIELGAPETLF